MAKNTVYENERTKATLEYFWFQGVRCLLIRHEYTGDTLKAIKAIDPTGEMNMFHSWHCGYIALSKRQLRKVRHKKSKTLELKRNTPLAFAGGCTYFQHEIRRGDYEKRYWIGFDTMHYDMENIGREETIDLIKTLAVSSLLI